MIPPLRKQYIASGTATTARPPLKRAIEAGCRVLRQAAHQRTVRTDSPAVTARNCGSSSQPKPSLSDGNRHTSAPAEAKDTITSNAALTNRRTSQRLILPTPFLGCQSWTTDCKNDGQAGGLSLLRRSILCNLTREH